MNNSRMPAVNKSNQMKTSSSTSCIRTISSYVSNTSSSSLLSSSLSASNIRNKTLNNTTTTKCPHVVLIGNVYNEDLDLNHRREVQFKKQRHSIKQNEEKEELNEENYELKCDECEQRRNLWLCLRETCMYVGCACSKDEKSNRHMSLHAQTHHHPLSISLSTQTVWCELCNKKIVLEHNNPPYRFKSASTLKPIKHFNENTNEKLEDHDLMEYLDSETLNSHKKLFQSLQTKSISNSYSSYLFNFNYASDLNGYSEDQENQSEEDDDEDAEDDTHDESDLNDYFTDSYYQRIKYNKKKKKKKTKINETGGKLGLDNLGNTCYANAALQALSNCYAFTSYFLECTSYLEGRLLNQAAYIDLSSFNKQLSLPCLSNSYAKLMIELWKQPNHKRRFNQTSFSPNEFIQVIKYINPMFRGHMQHDSQEFLIYLMDQLHEELKRPIWEKIKPIEDNTKINDDKTNDFNEDEQEEDSDEETIHSNGNLLSDLVSKDVDSGIFRLSINTNSTTNNNNNNDDNESVDSYETCSDSAVISNDNLISCDENNDSKIINQSSASLLSISPEVKRLKLKDKSISSSSSESNSSLSTTQQVIPTRVMYSSIVSELFEGKLIGQVQCLECLNISTTTESFLHLSLPIPTKEYLQALHAKLVNKNNLMLNGNGASNGTDEQVPYQGWISWMMDLMKGFIWSQTIKLTECLTAFFSEDDLKGDNMYSCEKCKKLTNGVKYSKLLELPETLIIHLKRFKHDSMFSTGKISSYVSFPLDDLEMRPFVHKECKNEVSQYDLSSIICHHGSSNGGHYTCYARNYFDEDWYEFDDSYCRKVDSLTVQNIQAYVLFYKKKTNKIDTIKEQLRSMILTRTSSVLSMHTSLLKPYYISKQWLQKLKHFSEPGPIDNSDFLCKHNLVRPVLWAYIDKLAIPCSADTWLFLVKHFGLKRQNEEDDDESVCNYLYPCAQCQLDDEQIKQRQLYEKEEFMRLNSRSNTNVNKNGIINSNTNNSPTKFYAINANWFKLWEQFVQSKHCPQSHQIPGPINNLSICNQQLLKQQPNNPIYQLNKNSNFYKIDEDSWRFLKKIYDGGPDLQVNASGGSKPSSPKTTNSYALTNQLKVEETQL